VEHAAEVFSECSWRRCQGGETGGLKPAIGRAYTLNFALREVFFAAGLLHCKKPLDTPELLYYCALQQMLHCTNHEVTEMKMNETYEMMVKATNEGYANARKLADLNLSVWDKLVAKQMELMTLCMDAGSKQFDAVKDVERPDELVGKQMSMVRECGEKLLEKNREMVDLLASTREEYQGWVEESVNQVQDQFAKAGTTARKSTRTAA
jgi:hypothetical protein